MDHRPVGVGGTPEDLAGLSGAPTLGLGFRVYRWGRVPFQGVWKDYYQGSIRGRFFLGALIFRIGFGPMILCL